MGFVKNGTFEQRLRGGEKLAQDRSEKMSTEAEEQPGQGKGMRVRPHMPIVFKEKQESPCGK